MRPSVSKVIPAGVLGNGNLDRALIRMTRSSSGNKVDRGFAAIAVLSVVLHSIFMLLVRNHEVPQKQTMVIEDVPERFAKLIVERPLPKVETVKNKNEKKTEAAVAEKTVKSETASEKQPGVPVSAAAKAQAKRSVDTRVARVEQKLRTVGVLGMLTGVGTTAKGPSVVDVLGSIKERKESSVDLEAALDKMTGLQKTKDVDVLERKLVKSKDLTVSHKENIDDLLANVGRSESIDLVKKGAFIIQKPESIEGAASSNVKRDNSAINQVVASHKTSIRMSYEKYLKRDPALAGKVTVRFTIAASGNVSEVTIVENTTGNSDLEDEIMRKIRMWQFEPVPEGDVTVTYPFVFSSAG